MPREKERSRTYRQGGHTILRHARDESDTIIPLTEPDPAPKLPEYPQPAYLRYRRNNGAWHMSVYFGQPPVKPAPEDADFYSKVEKLPLDVHVPDPTNRMPGVDVRLSLFGPDGSPNFMAIRTAFPAPVEKVEDAA